MLLFPALAICFPQLTPAHAQGTLSPIFTNGPTSNRINIVVISEGYTSNQLGQFLVDATNAVNHLLSAQPYQEYRSFFNAFAISVASLNSGSDHPENGIYKDTYFNSTFNSYGYQSLLTIPPNNYETNYNMGQGRVDSLVTNLVPEFDLVILLVNDIQKGSSALFQRKTLISSLHFTWPDMIRHESGHAFANLGDEYETSCPATPAEYPNVTAQTNRSLIKWRHWILESTPIPTPETQDFSLLVGLFQGAQCQSSGWYRPKLDCRMRTESKPFCEVCSEQIVYSIYQHVRPIESFSPPVTNVSLTTTQAVLFSVTPLQPQTHSLSVQWFTNGIAVTGETNQTYLLLPTLLTNGTNTIRAEVSDTTPIVRNDPDGRLRDSVTWALDVNITELRLLSPQRLPGGQFTFDIAGNAPHGFIIQASTNLAHWTSLSTNTLTNGMLHYTNAASSDSRRFYRTTSIP